MSFHSLIDGNHTKTPTHHRKHGKTRLNPDSERSTGVVKPKKQPRGKRGCEFCPLNKIHGVHKIFGHVHGRDIFVWAQSPGKTENHERNELLGPAGKWLWYELRKVGIKRKHCDIQNVVRCWPVDKQKDVWPPFVMRTPTKEEIKCCSIYNEGALEKSKAKLHLVFGQIAQKSLLGTEYKKDKKIFWSEKLGAWVACLAHPAYFVRQGYQAGDHRPASSSLKGFRRDLRAAIDQMGSSDRFGYVKSLDTVGITTRKMGRYAYEKIKRAAESGARVIADMEEGDVNDKRVALCCGFAVDTKRSYTFALVHPDAPASKEARKLNEKLVIKLLSNPDIKKGAHYGVSDCDAVERLLKIKVQGYDYDTLLGEYFHDPNAKAYGLAAVAERRFPEFMGYKDIIGPEAFTEEFQKKIEGKKKLSLSAAVEQAKQAGQINLAGLPWKKMVVYNGADCILEKKLEETQQHVNPALMSVYRDASFVLYRMERTPDCQPLFDYDWHRKLKKLFPIKRKRLAHRLKKLWRRFESEKKFNPNSPLQITKLLFDKDKLALPFTGKPTTRAKVLSILGQKYPEAKLVVEFRQVDKIESTYMDSYKNCADLNGGHLRTNWKQTGTATSRLSSGRTKDRKNDAVINFQNIHGDWLLKCLLISDLRWYRVYQRWLEEGDFTESSWVEFEDFYVYLGLDFSQMELRVLAQKSGDKNLIKMFSMGTDPHVEVGHALTGWPKEKIAHDERVRRFIKNMQFGIVFGLQPEGLHEYLISREVDTTLHEVKKYWNKYFQMFPGVRRMQESDIAFAEQHEYVETLLGFRRALKVSEQKELGDEWEGAYWGNQAINTPVQGTAHNLMMVSVATLERKPEEYDLLKHPQLEIHDAMYFRVKLKHLVRAIVQGRQLLEHEPLKAARKDFHLKWDVPLEVKPKAGFRFGVMVEDGLNNEWDFLNAWCEENKKLQADYKKQLHELQQ